MLDLEPYRAVSLMPPLKRDLSIAVDEELTAEELGDRIRGALGDAVLGVEAVTVVSETAYEDLPAVARTRLGMRSGQKNVLLRVVIRHLERTLTDEEGNGLRDRIYAAIHEGDAWMWSIDQGR
jgi:phenylalanyl-tRNA synthetase alpha chain